MPSRLELQVYAAVVGIPFVAFVMPAHGIWSFLAAGSFVEWLSLAAVWIPYWLLVCQAPIWHFVGLANRKIVPAVFGAAVLYSVYDLGVGAPWGWEFFEAHPYEFAWRLFTGGVAGGIAAWFRAGMSPPSAPVDLEFPFAEGDYWVVQGGGSVAGNRHLKLLSGDKPEARGQAHGVDLVEVNDWGFRAYGLMPRDLEKYVIFGRTVRAPCDGRVVEIEGELPDLPPPQHDADNPNGNQVWIAGDGFEVLLAHLKNGSLVVEAGEEVEAGDVVGEIGNSGRTTEPHLHIHVQRSARQGPRMSGDPVPLTFDGVYPVQAQRM